MTDKYGRIAKRGRCPSVIYLHWILFHRSNRLRNLRHQGTFNPFPENITAKLAGSVDGARRMQGIGGTAAAAVKFSPAILALRLCVAVALFKLGLQLRPRDAFPDVPHAIRFIPDKLVAWEQFAPWRDSEVFCA